MISAMSRPLTEFLDYKPLQLKILGVPPCAQLATWELQLWNSRCGPRSSWVSPEPLVAHSTEEQATAHDALLRRLT